MSVVSGPGRATCRAAIGANVPDSVARTMKDHDVIFGIHYLP
jgi:hypothetical protein